jgi:hypothetical protein
VSTEGCGSIVTTPPTDFNLNVSEPVDPSTVQASDLTVNGIPADSAIVINGNMTIVRKIEFNSTGTQFPFRVHSGRKFKITQPLTITVIGKAFFDIGHIPADQSTGEPISRVTLLGSFLR